MSDCCIGFPLFDRADLMDVTGPLELLGELQKPKVRLLLIGPSDAPVALEPGVRIVPHTTFEDCPQLDVLIVPGGSGLLDALQDARYMAFLCKQAREARYVVSVCGGALALAAAGLLNGYSATTHWASLCVLGLFPQVTLAPGYPRYVISGNRITTGGVSSGMDMALALCALLGGGEQAKQVQLLVQYAPDPPYSAGDPATTDPVTWGRTNEMLAPMIRDRVDFVRKLLRLEPS